MRLGLIGTGKQGQRYLQEKNGGRHIVVSGSRRIPLDGVDGVIIATHPAGHKELALEAIAAGKAVLIEKPLALNLRDCMEIIDAAEKTGVGLMVAHTHLWSRNWLKVQREHVNTEANAHVTYVTHSRDYSPWLDWAPHGLALLADIMPHADTHELRASMLFEKSTVAEVMACGEDWEFTSCYDSYEDRAFPTPMWRMVKEFVAAMRAEEWCDLKFQRRVYRALFAEE